MSMSVVTNNGWEICTPLIVNFLICAVFIDNKQVCVHFKIAGAVIVESGFPTAHIYVQRRYVNAPWLPPYLAAVPIVIGQYPFIVCGFIVLGGKDGLLHGLNCFSHWVSPSFKYLYRVDFDTPVNISICATV